MLLPAFKRLYKQDFEPQYQKLIDQLGNSLNIGIESLYNALNKSVSLKDNILCTVKDITVTVDANGVPTTQTVFSLDSQLKNSQIIGTTVIYCINTSNSATVPTGGIFATFTQTTNGILINNITGLPAGQTFTVRIVAWGQ